MKRIAQVGVPLLGGAAVASTIPGLMPALGGAAELAASGSQSLLAPAIQGAASLIGDAVATSLGALPFGAGALTGGAVEGLALGAGNAVVGALPAIAGVGMAAKATSSAIDATKQKIEQITGTNSKAIAAGSSKLQGQTAKRSQQERI